MPSEDETARLLRQQAEDLGNHRITALPLGDRQPGRRGAFQRSSRPIQGAGDARFDLGPRPGGPALGPSVRRAEVDQRWLAVFDDSMVIERPDGIGGGDLHREGINFRPRRRRSLSDVSISQSVRDALITETRNIAARNPVGPSSFRGRGGGPRRFPVPPVQPLGRPRYQSANTQLNSQSRGPVIQPRPARPGIPGNARHGTGNWSAPGLVHDQGAFFDKMTKNTGLRCPPMVVNQPGTSKNSKSLAKPMASVKDLPLEVISSQTEKPVQPIEPSDQPPEPADQLTEQPKPKPTSSFIPPHLRHTLKKQGPESEVEGKQVESNVEQTSQPVILVQASSTAPAPVGDRPDVNPARKQLSLLAEEVRRVPRTSTSSALRSVSQGGSPRIRPQFFPPLGESRNPLTSAPKLRGNAPPFPFPIPLGFYISPEFATQFWNLVAKPLWEQLLEDYDDVQQQIIFLTWYYAEKPHEWKEVMKTGPPTREMILRISEEYMDEDQKAILAYRKAQESKFKKVISPKLGSVTQPPSDWWKFNATDSIAISEWAGKLQESHRNAMLESLKDRIAEERDPVQTKMLYAKMAFLMHEAKGGPGSLGAPGKQLEEPNDEKDGDVSVLVLDTECSKEDKEKDLSSLIKLMWEHGLNPEGDSLTEEDFPLTEEQQASPEPECLPPPSTSPPAPLSITTPTPNISTANSPPPSPPRQNRFKGLASAQSRASSAQNHVPPSHSNTPPSHSTAPPPKGRHRSNRGQNAPKDPFKPRGTVTTPAHRDQSDERRQREKQERMKEINEKFASTKAGQTRGSDGHQEFTPSLLEFPAHLLNFGPETVVQLVPDDTIEDLNEMTFEDIEESEHSQVPEDQDPPLPDDQEEPSTDDFMHLEKIMEHQPGISEEEIGRIREMNRDSVPTLAVNCYWSFGLRFRSPVRPGDYFTVELDCTARMPADFLKQLRDKIGVEDWEAVSSHPGFRAVVAHATRGFFIKMARKWGPQFIHGIAD
ncbi:hypothetical protein TWF788_004061 [Orbilia oligospora]|uniref:Uncharacterized protein n=1 Tax=Orbilia oligospora TaxID=2813651 RepID=A0A7C8KDH2_ORBOL|nr:hypothetical protein TWF788_004061 [Orbilia oligospora]